MNIICAPGGLLQHASSDEVAFAQYGRTESPRNGWVGNGLLPCFKQGDILAPDRAWDLLALALAVSAADKSCPRGSSSDGWTRVIGLTVAVTDKLFWDGQAALVESLLRFLSGDLWTVRFIGGGEIPGKIPGSDSDCVCLLSGGLDSLTGALDLTSGGRRPTLVSQVVQGDKEKQRKFAVALPGERPHLQFPQAVSHPLLSERSQRARSFMFIALGALAATGLEKYGRAEAVELFVPENGFIGLNIPLTPLRLGSLSTRTTHPVVFAKFQELLDAAGLNVRITNPYRFRTKGEMLVGCGSQDLLLANATSSTSCGRFGRMGYHHCGRCVPCLVRRAAFLHWGVDDTTGYRFDDLSQPDSGHRGFDDVKSVAFAVERVKNESLDRWLGSSLIGVDQGERDACRETAGRGLDELAAFLAASGVS